ncbi:MAG: hypothetical protein AB1578_19770 [Thermodesulfobacteriota bacterium]
MSRKKKSAASPPKTEAPLERPADPSALLVGYGCGPIPFTGDDGLDERHLL